MAHSLAKYARNITEDMFWMEDSPLLAWDTMIQYLFIEWKLISFSPKKKKRLDVNSLVT